MHTISQARPAGVLIRIGVLALSVGELAVALVWHGAMRLVIWQERVRERRCLASLDEHMLRDIGLSRSDVDRETSKPFWER